MFSAHTICLVAVSVCVLECACLSVTLVFGHFLRCELECMVSGSSSAFSSFLPSPSHVQQHCCCFIVYWQYNQTGLELYPSYLRAQNVLRNALLAKVNLYLLGRGNWALH
jgi:hypothetical protein